MNTEKILEETNTLAKTCQITVSELKNLKTDMENRNNLRFYSELYHRIDIMNHTCICTMCAAGALARGLLQIKDNQTWSIRSISNIKIHNRFKVIDNLRQGSIEESNFLTAWPDISKANLSKFSFILKFLPNIYKFSNIKSCSDIDGFIRLYENYSEFFEHINI